jgi:hypothetical protein
MKDKPLAAAFCRRCFDWRCRIITAKYLQKKHNVQIGMHYSGNAGLPRCAAVECHGSGGGHASSCFLYDKAEIRGVLHNHF